MILNKTITPKTTSKGYVHISVVLEVQLFQYFEPIRKRAVVLDNIKEAVASAPPCSSISGDICI